MAILNGKRYAITPEMEDEIDALYTAGLGTQKEIAECYGVSDSTISKITRKRGRQRFDAAVTTRAAELNAARIERVSRYGRDPLDPQLIEDAKLFNNDAFAEAGTAGRPTR